MTPKAVVPRAVARRDVDDAINFYVSEGAIEAALGFIDTLEVVFLQIAAQPKIGSPRYAHELALPGLRCWLLPGYPHLVFYLERADTIDVWRVLHTRRDIPVWLVESS